MMDVVMFALGGLTGLVACWFVAPLFDAFMRGLMGLGDLAACRRRIPDEAET